jgi:hypothetical protein
VRQLDRRDGEGARPERLRKGQPDPPAFSVPRLTGDGQPTRIGYLLAPFFLQLAECAVRRGDIEAARRLAEVAAGAVAVLAAEDEAATFPTEWLAA